MKYPPRDTFWARVNWRFQVEGGDAFTSDKGSDFSLKGSIIIFGRYVHVDVGWLALVKGGKSVGGQMYIQRAPKKKMTQQQ